MTIVKVENLDFDFDATVTPCQFEVGGQVVASWPNGSKVVDVVACENSSPPQVAWYIEAKDYRTITHPPKPANLQGLATTVEAKVRDTLAALPVVAANGIDPIARADAALAQAAVANRVVLHLEPHPPGGGHSALFPHGFAANIMMKLRQLVKDIDPNALVLSISTAAAAPVPWSVS